MNTATLDPNADATESGAAAAKVVNPDHEADINWKRWEYGKLRGHRDYVYQAAKCEAFYFGGDSMDPQYKGHGHWRMEDWQALQDGGRPSYTMNEIMPGINSAIGYQIHNRLDISYRPSGGLADTDKAALHSKISMHILGQNKFHWLETQVFSDGMIEQRGYYDIRMSFDKNVFGDVVISVEDPRDVVPDPDAKTYNPEGWADVCVSRWYTGDQIEQHYGAEARAKAEAFIDEDGDFGTTDDSGPRNHFGDKNTGMWDAYRDADDGTRRYRIIDRQRWVYRLTKCAVYPTGDVKSVETATPEQIAGYEQQGAVIMRRMMRQVRWVVSTRWAVLEDDISPYDRFTIVPYFCYFRRGKTCGKVDNAIDSQQILNKAVSQFVHIVNTAANSGWTAEENSLVNMTQQQLEEQGSKTGLVLFHKQGTQAPKKIEPNPVPQGVDRLIDRAYNAIRNATTPDAMRGTPGQEISGVAIQSRQFAGQQELALPLDNLTHTREMVADFITYLKQTFYDNHRVFRITERDPRTGKEVTNQYEVNVWNDATGQFDNDLTVGDYDLVVDSVPMQVTFENSQFTQALEIKDRVPTFPDRYIVKYSNLADKGEILDQMDNAAPPVSPVDEAKANLANAQAENVKAQAADTRMTTAFAAVQAGAQLATMPAVGPLADALLGSVGFVDQNAPPAVPTPAAPIAGLPALPSNTDPLTPISPASPAVGAREGIEGGN